MTKDIDPLDLVRRGARRRQISLARRAGGGLVSGAEA
jgi:hypothetical protein